VAAEMSLVSEDLGSCRICLKACTAAVDMLAVSKPTHATKLPVLIRVRAVQVPPGDSQSRPLASGVMSAFIRHMYAYRTRQVYMRADQVLCQMSVRRSRQRSESR
jgi:hypothetical protein